MKHAVVLYNLGGPDSPAAVEPFLFNLFNDPAIISLPAPLRGLIARLIATQRGATARAIYERMGGASPIRPESEAQARALEAQLNARKSNGTVWRVFLAMRHWHPMIAETLAAIQTWGPDDVVLCPLYPQFSTTTTGSFLTAWHKAAARARLAAPTAAICCYPDTAQFVQAHANLLARALSEVNDRSNVRILFSAHGLPERTVKRGDPYPWQIERTAAAIMATLPDTALDWRVSYQSRVGPLAWIGPETREEIERAGAEKKGLVIVPIAFVSEHAETLVELDEEYRALAEQTAVSPYIRVPALRVHGDFITALAHLVETHAGRRGTWAAAGARLCPATFAGCPHAPGTAP